MHIERVKSRLPQIGFKEKILILFLLGILLSSTATGYICIVTLHNAEKSASHIAQDELLLKAKASLASMVQSEAELVNSFCSEIANDALSTAMYAYRFYEKGCIEKSNVSIYANFGYGDWKSDVNSSKIFGILDGTIRDRFYEEILTVCDEANLTKLKKALLMLANRNYTVSSGCGKKAIKINETIWSYLKSVNHYLKKKSMKGSCDQFLLYKFMFNLLNENAQNKIKRLFVIMDSAKEQIDSHPCYDMVRLCYWGNETNCVSLLYSKKVVDVPIPFQNIYYCPLDERIRKENRWEPVWFATSCIENLFISCTVPICRSPYEEFDENNTIIGSVTYWVHASTISHRITNLRIEKTGYAFMINSDGEIIVHPDADMLGRKLQNCTGLESVAMEMMNGSVGIGEVNLSNSSFCVAYAPVNCTGWSIALIVPLKEVILPAVTASRELEEKTKTLSLYLVISTSLVVAVLTIVGYYLMKRLMRPIQALTRGAKAISKGDFSCRIYLEQNDEIGSLARAFNMMASSLEDHTRRLQERTKEVERLLKQKEEFINQLGHDLKTPLTPIVNLLPIVREKVKDPEAQKLFDVISRNIHYIKSLVTKTLQFASLSSPSMKLNMEKINLSNEIDNVLERYRTILQKHNIKLENFVGKDIFVKADRLRLNELLDNIINNAIKYTPSGGKITVKARELNGEIEVSIHDTGIGMTKEQIKHIFEEFYRADESRHDVDSSGLGLSICKKIVEGHGGRIWAESPGLGGGSTFYFTLPAG